LTAAGAASSQVSAAYARSPSSAAVTITARADPDEVRPGGATTISGTVRTSTGPLARQRLELQASYAAGAPFRNIAHAMSVTGGRFRFAPVRSSHVTRYRVVDRTASDRSGAVVVVTVAFDVYPTAERVQAAARYLAARAGHNAFAVVDDRGDVAGLDAYQRFSAASVVKSMMLVAYLQMLAADRRALDRESEALLYPMIHSSDNAAASAVLAAIGQRRLDDVARQAGMRDYERAHGWWAFTQVSAADLARFFYVEDSLIPRDFVGYADRLESTIEASQSWGVPAVARPEFAVYFKGGWLPEEGVVNQAARLARPGITFAVALLSSGGPSMAYGEQTIAGVTLRLLGRAL
jgi:Beta-lactamase enzyme family